MDVRSGWRLMFLLPLAMAGCGGGGGGGHVMVRDSAGVVIVENAGPERDLGPTTVLVPDLTPADSGIMALPWGVAGDPGARRIYVIDRFQRRVVVFDGAGRRVGAFGRRGGGPGEFEDPSAIAMGDAGEVLVWDTGRGVLSRWSGDGRLLGERQALLPYWGPGFSEGHGVLVTVTARSSGLRMDQLLIRVHGEDTTVLATVGRQRVTATLSCGTMTLPKIFAPDVEWAARGDTVYVLSGSGYRIDEYVGGERALSIRRNIRPARVTDALALRRVASGRFRGFVRRCGVSGAELVRAVGHEDVTSPVRHVAVDPAGRLWVSRGLGATVPDSVDIIGADGRYLGSASVPGFPVAFVSDSEFVGFALGPLGGIRLGLYALTGDEAGGQRGPSRMSRRARTPNVRRAPAPEASGQTDAGWDTTTGSLVAGGARGARPSAVRAELREFRDCAGCPLMVELPQGHYLMGSPEGEAPAAGNPRRPARTEGYERPQVEVRIAYRLAMGKYEVTFDEWDRCVAAGGCDYHPDDAGWGRGDRPVMNLTRWWGDRVDGRHVACDGCGSRWDRESTRPVGSFPPNPWGLYDMLSNVQEWVADCWTPNHGGAPTDGSARTTDSPGWRDCRASGPFGEAARSGIIRGPCAPRIGPTTGPGPGGTGG